MEPVPDYRQPNDFELPTMDGLHNRRSNDRRSSQQFVHRDTSSVEVSPMLPKSIAPFDDALHGESIGKRKTADRQETESLTRVASLTNNDQESQDVDQEDQLSSICINAIDLELGKLISELCNHKKASKENKKQIELLKIELEKLIVLSVERSGIDDEDTAGLLHSILNNVKVSLKLIVDCLNSSTFPEGNIKYLYHLARFQLPLYFTEFPYPTFSLMIFNLKEKNQSSSTDSNASDKTKVTIDKMLNGSRPDEAMSDQRIKQFINVLEFSIDCFKTSCKANDDSNQITLGAWLKLYKMAQMPKNSVQPSEPVAKYFNFSYEEVEESIFPQLNSLCTIVQSLSSEFISLLVSLDKHGRNHSGNQNLYYLEAERWSVSVLEFALSNNHLTEESTYLGDIISQLQTLKEIADHQSANFIADSSVFLRTLFASKKPENFTSEACPSEAFTTPLNQSFKNCLLDGLFHFFDEIFDEPDVDHEEIAHIKEIKSQVTSWLHLARNRREHENRLKEIIDAIKGISLSMKNIRSCIRDTPEQPLFNQVLRTSFKHSASKHFLDQQIDTLDEKKSPIKQLMSIFEGFELKLEIKKANLFDMGRLKIDFAQNSRVNNRMPIEPWHLQFVEVVLDSDQHSRSKKAQAKENHSPTYFFARSIKNPSVLGTSMLKIDKGLAKLCGGKWYHEKHKVDESTELGSTGPKGTGPSCKVDLPDEDEGVDINWTKGAGGTAHNFLHDNDANHAENGVLEENVGGLDFALPSSDVMKNWCVAFEKSTVTFFSRHPKEAKTQQLKARNNLNSLANNKASIHHDYSNFLLETLHSLKPENKAKSQTDQFEKMVKQAIDEYGKDQLTLIAHGKTGNRVECMEPLKLSTEFCKGLSPFFKTIILEITSTDFRHDITADIYSVQILQQITGFLNMPVKVDSVTQKMYKHLGLNDTTFQNLEVYFRRLASEYFAHKTDLVAERFYEMFSRASPLTRKHSSFLSALQNNHINDFLTDVESQLGKSDLSSEPPTTEGMKAVMESVQKCYKKVLTNLQSELKQSQREPTTEIIILEDGNHIELSPAETRKKIHNKIRAGETLLNNLEATIKALNLDDKHLTSINRWNRFSEWVEDHEASIMAAYCMAMGASIYYLLHGKSYTPHLYASGGDLSFGSFDIGVTSVDAFQVVTTTGAVLTQFGQATGWKNDVRRMLELLEGADAFSFITTEPPSALQSDMINLYLSNYTPSGNQTTYDTTCQNGSYRSGSNYKDTFRDVFASALTRESPLQKSHPKTDRAIRTIGSTATGALNGAAFSAFSGIASAICAPFCSWAPVIDQPATRMITAGAVAGCLGGVTSGTKLDYVSRGLNFSTRFFADDRMMGGMSGHVAQAIKCMRNRKDSTLMRLLVENPFKAALNICGFSLPESFTKFFLHLFDGYIAQIEIGDFAQWRKEHQKLLSSAAAINKAFDGKELTQYDHAVLIETLGEESVEKLGLNHRTDPKARNPRYQRILAGVVNLFAYYIMVADLYYFLFAAIRKASQLYKGAASTNSGTTEKSHISPAPDSSDPTSPAVTEPSFTTSGDSAPYEGECPADTKKLPYAGKGWLECPVAIYEEFRKSAPFKRFFDVALFKTLPNLANYLDVKAHNAALGKKSNDQAMVITLKAGIAKNTALGPLERLLQMSDSILLKCVGDVVNQMNTNIKEAMESVGQRERDKASEPLKKAAKDLFCRLLVKADYNLSQAENDMVDLISHWQKNIGFKGLNALATMRQLIAQETLKQCDASEGDFSDYKKTAMDSLAAVMPSIKDKSAVVPENLREDLERLKASVNQFTIDVNADRDMFKAVSPLLNTLSSVDKKVVDYYVESLVYEPLLNKSSTGSMEIADENHWMGIQHMYGQLATVA